MDPQDQKGFEERLSRILDRIASLEGRGVGIEKVRTLVQGIQGTASKLTKENLEKAVVKVESYIDKLEAVAPEPAPEVKKGEGASVDLDPEHASALLERVRDLMREVTGLGGSLSPVEQHLNGIVEAFNANDWPLFKEYHGALEQWFGTYLPELVGPYLDSINREVAELGKAFGALGEAGRISADVDRLARLALDIGASDIDGLMARIREVGELKERMLMAHSKLLEEHASSTRKLLDEIKGTLPELPEGTDLSDIKGGVEEAESALTRNEVVQASLSIKELSSKVREIDLKGRTNKLERTLEEIDPLLVKLASFGDRSKDVIASLSYRKEELLRLSKNDPRGALEGMEELLERSAKAIDEMEEGRASNLKDRIDEMRAKALELKDLLDVKPVLSILQKAEDLAGKGDLEGGQAALEKAGSAIGKLKERKLLDQAAQSLDELEARMEGLRKRSMDTTPMKEPIKEARAALERKDLTGFEQAMRSVEERMELVRMDELRVEYHSRLMVIVNDLGRLKQEGIDASHLEKRLEAAREVFHERKYRDAIEQEKALEAEIGRAKLKKTLEKRLRSVESTLEEASALAIDVGGLKDSLKAAEVMMSRSEIESALEKVVKVQLEIEALLAFRTFSFVEGEILAMARECNTLSIQVGDIEGGIKKARELADDERPKEAMELLLRTKEEMWGRLKQKKAEAMIGELSQRIREAKGVGVDISPFRVALTKAKIFFEAHDMDSAVTLCDTQIRSIIDLTEKKRAYQERVDEVLGRLIGHEAKIGQMTGPGLQVNELRASVDHIRTLVEMEEIGKAEEELGALEERMNRLMKVPSRARPVRVQEPQEAPAASGAKGGTPPQEQARIDPEEAYAELKVIVKGIQDILKKLPPTAEESDRIKKDIQRIQLQVLQKNYIEAYKIAKDCYSRIRAL